MKTRVSVTEADLAIKFKGDSDDRVIDPNIKYVFPSWPDFSICYDLLALVVSWRSRRLRPDDF